MKPASTSAERLAPSRERLRRALNGLLPAADDPQATQQAERGNAPWWVALAALPGAGIVIEATRAWWVRHPMRANIDLALDATRAVVQPVAQRHPVALVAAVFVVGGLLGWHRPLRGLLRPALFAGLLPQRLMSSLTTPAATTSRR